MQNTRPKFVSHEENIIKKPFKIIKSIELRGIISHKKIHSLYKMFAQGITYGISTLIWRLYHASCSEVDELKEIIDFFWNCFLRHIIGIISLVISTLMTYIRVIISISKHLLSQFSYYFNDHVILLSVVNFKFFTLIFK